MNFLQKLRVDTWYGLVLYLGSAFLLFPDTAIVSAQHMFGLGFGMVLVGLAFFMAEKGFSEIKPPNAYTGPATVMTWKEIKHNAVSLLLTFVGAGIICIFGYFLVRDLFVT